MLKYLELNEQDTHKNLYQVYLPILINNSRSYLLRSPVRVWNCSLYFGTNVCIACYSIVYKILPIFRDNSVPKHAERFKSILLIV